MTHARTHAAAIDDNFNREYKLLYNSNLNQAFDQVLYEFDGVLRRYVAFNVFFLMLCLFEVGFLVVSFTFLMHSLILALGLGAVFFTIFSYFTLKIYFQTKKPEQIKGIRKRYIEACKSMMEYQEGVIDCHIALASACSKLANRLHGREYNLYYFFAPFSSLVPYMERFSCWWHWEDVLYMKELLLQLSVDEHITMVKNQPTSLQTHAALANAYVMLSGLYIDPRKMEGYEDDRWIPEGRYDEKTDKRFRAIAERAIEEFKILSEYAPDDPWVHSQLAYSYHDLQMPHQEIKEYETIQRLVPTDRDNLYKLGRLYFQQGFNAKGLRVFEELKKAHYGRAESLIKFYGSCAYREF